jgi:hypothetical protein
MKAVCSQNFSDSSSERKQRCKVRMVCNDNKKEQVVGCRKERWSQLPNFQIMAQQIETIFSNLGVRMHAGRS